MTIVYNVYISAGIPSWLQPMGNEMIKMEGYYFSTDEEIKQFVKKCKRYIKRNNKTSENNISYRGTKNRKRVYRNS